MREIMVGQYSGPTSLPNTGTPTRRVVEDRALLEFLADICVDCRYAPGTEGERKYHEFLAAILPGWKPPLSTETSSRVREMEWNPADHPRGGNPNNPGEFSLGWGPGGNPNGARPSTWPDEFAQAPGAVPLESPRQANNPVGVWPDRPKEMEYDEEQPVRLRRSTAVTKFADDLKAFDNVKKAFDALPTAAKADLKANKVQVDSYSSYDGYTKRMGFEPSAATNGSYHRPTGVIVVVPWSSAKEVGDAQKAVDPLGTLYHETGHFYDHKLGLSENQDIANAYKLDKERLEQRLAADGELTEVQNAMIREATSKLSEAIANGIAHGMTNIGEDEKISESARLAAKYMPELIAKLRAHPEVRKLFRKF